VAFYEADKLAAGERFNKALTKNINKFLASVVIM
jgi:hypothetical protein